MIGTFYWGECKNFFFISTVQYFFEIILIFLTDIGLSWDSVVTKLIKWAVKSIALKNSLPQWGTFLSQNQQGTLYHLLLHAILKIEYTLHSGPTMYGKNMQDLGQIAQSWTGWKCLNQKLWLKGNLLCWPPTIGALKSVCTCPSYSEGSQAPEFLVLCMSRVTSVPESGCQPPTQLGAGLEVQWSITQVSQGTLQRFCFSKIIVPGPSLSNSPGGVICL